MCSHHVYCILPSNASVKCVRYMCIQPLIHLWCGGSQAMENFSCLSLSLFIDGNADATIYEIAAVSLRKIKLMTCVCDRLLLQKQAVKINVQQQKKERSVDQNYPWHLEGNLHIVIFNCHNAYIITASTWTTTTGSWIELIPGEQKVTRQTLTTKPIKRTHKQHTHTHNTQRCTTACNQIFPLTYKSVGRCHNVITFFDRGRW